MIAENLNQVYKQIEQACRKKNRNPKSITLVAVSKEKPDTMIAEAVLTGQIHFGENYVQEFLQKGQALAHLHILWHFIGHLQRRKVRDIVGRVALIHSVDSLPLAFEINKRAGEKKQTQRCLLQINIAAEKTKSGLAPDDAITLLKNIDEMKNMKIIGLMVIPPFLADPEKVRPYFRRCADLRDKINRLKVYHEPLTELSMGMSHDFAVALEEGATIIRVGRDIFGER